MPIKRAKLIPQGFSGESEQERGFAILLAIFALFTLTLMAVAAVSVASADFRVSQMHRKRSQVRYIAQAGLDQARDMVRQNVGDPATLTNFVQNWYDYNGADRCVPLVGLSNAQAYASGPMALGKSSSCVTKNIYFSGPAPGYGMETGTASGGAPQYQMIAFDIQANSYHMDAGGLLLSRARSRTGGLISAVCEAPCGR